MHLNALVLPALLPSAALAFPWAANFARSAGGEGVSAVKTSPLLAAVEKRQAAICPVHLTRQGAAPYSKYYPSQYTGAKNGQPGTGKGGVLVPAAGDTAHAYEAPGPSDIRGPCPAINMFANHHFISHDGLTTYTELVDAAQNVFNWQWNLAAFVAAFGIIQDGDPVTEMLSIGCTGGLTVPNTGLNTHNKFEADQSMARTDFNLSPTGDAYDVNGTLFGQLINYCQPQQYSNDRMGQFNQLRFNQSLATNGNFFNGFLQFFVLGTALLPLNSFANYQGGTPNPTEDVISTFWGTSKKSDGSWQYNRNESIPQSWYNRPDSYSLQHIIAQISADYLKYPAPLGGNTGAPNTFVGLNYPGFVQNGVLTNATPQGLQCLLYNTISIGVPTSLTQMAQLSAAQSTFLKNKLGSTLSSFAC